IISCYCNSFGFDAVHGEGRRASHRIPAAPILTTGPPFASIHRHRGCSHTPADSSARIVNGFARLGRVDDQQSDTLLYACLNLRSDLDSSVDLLAKPLNIQIGAE